ncbi:MAG: hypothetical protein HC848_01645 [Limnobacter sp.]|nr:hypothetical protein [Limnobacter sp.]
MRPSQSELLNKRSDALLDLNLQYFGVPFCQGNLATDTRTLGIVQPIDRTGDLVAAIQEELQQKKDLQPTLNTPSADNNAA